MQFNLTDDPNFSRALELLEGQGLIPARVSEENRGSYLVWIGTTEIPAKLSGRLRFDAPGTGDFPAVGDWVGVEPVDQNSFALIHRVLPRKTVIRRKAAGRRMDCQVLASNVDLVFIMQSLDGDFNPRRLERTCVLAAESGAETVVVIGKTDLADQAGIEAATAEACRAAAGARIVPFSAKTGQGMETIQALVANGVTACFLGSSGVGKSTLINLLAGEELMETGPVRESDSRGRHVTTRRQMIRLQNGGLVIDTPGLRKVGLWGVECGILDAFPDISRLSASCRYADCAHTHEPGCAVLAAVESGALDAHRLENFRKLVRESEYAAAKSDASIRMARKMRERRMGREIKRFLKHKGRK